VEYASWRKKGGRTWIELHSVFKCEQF